MEFTLIIINNFFGATSVIETMFLRYGALSSNGTSIVSGFGHFIGNKSGLGGFGACSNVASGWFVPNNH